jgi:nicotinate-nucleotide--dimethylbenzimidazole phosphoribosyltransferase
MSATADVDVFTIDIGMNTKEYPTNELITGAVVNKKVAKGTNNLARGAAMSLEQCRKAINCGIDIVGELKQKGYGIVATGEMGIGNTTPTSALAAALLKLSAEEVTGRGAGLDNEGLARKKQVISMALDRNHNLIKQFEDSSSDSHHNVALKLLAELGGYEIAGMAGLFLGGVRHHIPVIIDGAISAVSALVASEIDEEVPRYALASHVSEEISGRLALEKMQLPAIIHGHMCLGEGSGAVALIPLLDMALAVYGNMGTFKDLSIEAYERSGKPGYICE